MLLWWQPLQSRSDQVDSARALGLPQEFIDQVIGTDEPELFGVLEANWQAFNLFCDLETQFQTSVSNDGELIFSGLDYSAALAHLSVVVAREDLISVWTQVRFCERVLLQPEMFEEAI